MEKLNKKLISIASPAYNEAENIPLIVEEVKRGVANVLPVPTTDPLSSNQVMLFPVAPSVAAVPLHTVSSVPVGAAGVVLETTV